MEQKIFIMAGEASGDLHGSMLVKKIKQKNSGFFFKGVGGKLMREEGVETLYDCSDFSSMGVIEPLMKIFFYKKALAEISSYILENNFNSVVLIDFPGFNLSLAKKLKDSSIKVIYYISPQIWAWHYSRIKKIKKYIQAMVVLYPFEEELYRSEGVEAYFAGNPLVDIVKEKLSESKELACKIKRPCIAMLPGSRMSEVKRHVKPMLEAAELLYKKYKSAVLFPVIEGDTGDYIKERIRSFNSEKKTNLEPVVNNTARAMMESDFIISSSGTATLEAALLGKPMIVIYKIGLVFELAARILIRVKNISLVNIVAGERVCPELLQREASAKNIYREAVKILDDKVVYQQMKSRIEGIKDKLGPEGAIDRIAELFISLFRKEQL